MNENPLRGNSRSLHFSDVSWKKLLLITNAGHFVTDFYNGFLPPLLPLIVDNMQLSLTSAGVLLTVLSISNSLLQPIAGLLADRLSRYYFVLIGPVISGVFMGMLGLVNNFGQMVTVLILSGIGTALFHPQAAALIGSIKNSRQGFSMSIFNTTGVLGVTAGSLIIVPLISQFGFYATAYTIVLTVIFAYYSWSHLAKFRLAPASKRGKRQLRQLIKVNRGLVLNLHLLVVVRAILILAFSGFVPLFQTSQGETVFFGAVSLAVFQFFSVVGMLLGGHAFDLFGAKKLLLTSFIFVPPLALLFMNLPGIYGLPFLAAMGFFLSSSTPVNIILGQKISPTNASFMSSIMMGFGWGIAGLLMTVIGALAEKVGIYQALTAVSFLSFAGILLSLTIPIKK
ncbi:MAG TPA: MFS transporter [bacterium]|nr:MFS transporter [bacterium]